MRFRVGRLSRFNDPFDSVLHFRGNGTEHERRQCEQMAQRVFEHRDKTNGVLCFSETWRDHVLWSHYADKHRGLVIVIRRPDGVDLNTVRYFRRRTSILISDLKDDSKKSRLLAAFKESHSIKSAVWEYEKEVRLVVDLSACVSSDDQHFLPISISEFGGVILGLRCNHTPAEIRDLFNRAGVPHAKIWKAKKSRGGFSLIRELAQI